MFFFLPQIEFRDNYKPSTAPRTKKFHTKPIAAPRTKIVEKEQALKGFTKSYEISIKNDKDPLLHFQNTRKAVEIHMETILTSMKGLKFVETMKVTFIKQTVPEEKTIKSGKLRLFVKRSMGSPKCNEYIRGRWASCVES